MTMTMMMMMMTTTMMMIPERIRMRFARRRKLLVRADATVATAALDPGAPDC